MGRSFDVLTSSLEVELTPRFRECERHWARDEELHYLGFRAAYAALVDLPEEAIEADLERRAREVDFEPIAELFADEFAIACLMAYDELATVRVYRSGSPRYAALGPEMLAFVRRVTADEGRHFRNFLELVRAEHAHRLGELDEVVERIRSFEGTPYRNTFVLDHDDDVWSEEIFDEAAGLVRRRLRAS